MTNDTPPSLRRTALLLLITLTVCSGFLWAADPPTGSPGASEKAIRESATAFVDAFNKGSAKEVAALWTAQGSLADDQGEVLKGRKAIEDKYTAFFKQYPGAKMEVTIKSIEFPTSTVAVEDGTATVSVPNAGPPASGRYTVVHTQDNGKWLMASVREAAIDVPSNYGHLQDLGWLIGKWESKTDATTSESEFRWIANKSFIQRDYATRREGSLVASGTQIIGFDPKSGTLRSWSFDAAGGHGTGYWVATPEGWQIQSSGVQPDGTSTTSVDCVIRVPAEPNVFGWRSINRRMGGVQLPNTPEVVFDRAKRK